MNSDKILTTFLKYANLAYPQAGTPVGTNIQSPTIQSGQPPKRALELVTGGGMETANGNSLSTSVKPATNPAKFKV